MNHVKETIVRSEDPGPTPEVVCAEDGTAATATWIIPAGQLLGDDEAPVELGTGGYAYFTPHDAPTDVISQSQGGETTDLSDANLREPAVVSISTEVEPGVEYRAHILLAYEGEDGLTVHDDTVFVCEAPVAVAETTTTTVAQPQPEVTETADTLPATGLATGVLLPLAILFSAAGAAILKWAGADK